MTPDLTVTRPPESHEGRDGRVLKILHVGKYYPPHMGGIETHLRTLCEALQGSAQVRAVVANDESRHRTELVDQVPVERIGAWFKFAAAPICPAMVARIRATDADVVHIHLPNPIAVLAYLASGHRGKLVVTYHSDTVRQAFLGAAFEPLVHALLRRSSAIIATSPNYLATSLVLAKHREKCHVIPYGIPLQQFQQCDPSAVAKIREQFGERILIGVGRLVYYKGFENAIQAMRRVNARLLIVGSGPLLPKLQALAATHGVTDRVVFLGEIQNDQITPYYHAADAFVFPSVARSEAFGIVQIEAMAAGKPVVNTGLDSGVPFVSQHGITGLTVPPSDPDALAVAMNELLNDANLRSRYGQAARRRAEDEFSVETMTDRVMSLYRQTLNGGERGAGRL